MTTAWLLATVLAVTSPATAPATPTPSPTRAPVTLVGPRVDPGQAVTFPVEDFSGASEALVFASASEDGAVTDRGHRDFTLDSDVLFAFDKAALTPRARAEIAKVAATLKDGQAVTRVSVTGYTDDVGGDAYNLGLSKRRAEAVRRELAARLGSTVTVRAAGLGEADPVATNKTTAGRKLNRRVELRSS